MLLAAWHEAFGDLLAGDAQGLQQRISGTAGFPLAQRLAVYRNNHQQGLIGVLSQTFERCCTHVGEEYFIQLARAYVQQYPPVDVPLNDYGECFPAYLAHLQQERPELAAMAYLPDLARLDWLCDRVYDLPDRHSWSAEAFNVLGVEEQANARLCLSADCLLMASAWSLSLLWALHQGEAPAINAEALVQPEYLMITRQDYKVRLEVLPEHIYLLLQAVQQGRTLQGLVAEHAAGVAQLPTLIAKGWIEGFEVNECYAGT